MSTKMDLVVKATEALQAHERLCLALRSATKLTTEGPLSKVASEASRECSRMLDDLRETKSKLEGTAVSFPAVALTAEDKLQQLKQLTLMHVPSSLSAPVKSHLTQLVLELFQGEVQDVLYVVLMTCPWYHSTQDERGQQARHNVIFIIYASRHQQFLAPVNPHEKEKCSDIIDLGWICALEAYHFASKLVNGKCRYIEAFLQPQSAVVYEHPLWKELKSALEPSLLTGMRGFLEQTRGQSFGGVGKKSKAGVMKLADQASLHDFCDSFRLLHHTSQALEQEQLCLSAEELQQELVSPKHRQAADALEKLTLAYSESGIVRKDELFDLVMLWKNSLDVAFKARGKTDFPAPSEVEERVSKWLLGVRTDGVKLNVDTLLNEVEKNRINSLLGEMGGNVRKKILSAENVLLVARAGSFLYGLSTPQSDTDYIVIYKDPTENVLGRCQRPSESFECRGPDCLVEYGAYEVRLLAEMLWKCSIVILELVFADGLEYSSAAWKELQEQRQVFVTERAILQYFGLIKNNLAMIEKGKHQNSGRERKLFYQIFHKLYCLEYFLRGTVPRVRCTGGHRDFIMRIRNGPLEGDISRSELYNLANEKIEATKKALSQRPHRLPENVDYSFLSNWLLRVRGWPC